MLFRDYGIVPGARTDSHGRIRYGPMKLQRKRTYGPVSAKFWTVAGATAGSAIPGVGTLVGAAAGFVVGLITQWGAGRDMDEMFQHGAEREALTAEETHPGMKVTSKWWLGPRGLAPGRGYEFVPDDYDPDLEWQVELARWKYEGEKRERERREEGEWF